MPVSQAGAVLEAHDRVLIERALGDGALNSPLPAPTIDKPVDYLPLKAHGQQYRMLMGPHAGHEAIHRISPAGLQRWRYELSNDETGFIQVQSDGGLVMSGIEDVYTQALTRYAPAEPFMPANFQPGAEETVRMGVKVFDLENPDDLQHEGSLNVRLGHVGAFELNLPSGRFATVLLKASFRGQIGPAHVDDVQYRFFAKGVGLVAMVERRDVSAFVVYNDRLDLAKILNEKAP